LRYEVRGLSLNVEKNGSEKPALVFLPYWGGTLTTWNNVVAELKDSFMTVLMIHVAEPNPTNLRLATLWRIRPMKHSP
jgi:hypothetical protein